MTIPLKSLIIGAISLLLIGLSVGRYSVSTPTVKEVETTKTDDTKKVDTETKKNTTITVTELPNGKEATVTTIVEDTTTKEKDDTITQDNKQETITSTNKNILSVSALGGISINGFVPVYGLSINKNILGPVRMGLFGLSNGTAGVSIGLDF